MRPLLPHLIWLLSFTAMRPLAAQWYIGFDARVNHYRGSAHDTSGTHVTSEGRPGNGATVGLQLDRRWHRVGAVVRASYTNTGFTVSGNDISVTDRTTGRLLEFSTLVSTRVGGIGSSGAVRAELGPALHLWDFSGEIRSRVGGLAAAVYEWPIAKRFTGSVRLEGMLSPSWFDAADVPPEFERRVTWRYGVGLGLRYRL